MKCEVPVIGVLFGLAWCNLKAMKKMSVWIKWTASTADGEYIFPYMKVNETGDMFLIDWTYQEYRFAIYGKSPQDTSDRDMAGKIALAMIYNLGGEK